MNRLAYLLNKSLPYIIVNITITLHMTVFALPNERVRNVIASFVLSKINCSCALIITTFIVGRLRSQSDFVKLCRNAGK